MMNVGRTAVPVGAGGRGMAVSDEHAREIRMRAQKSAAALKAMREPGSAFRNPAGGSLLTGGGA